MIVKKEHKYKGLAPDEYEELFSNFLVDSWSYSKVSSFARNEISFEMSYIYNEPLTKSSSLVAGSAYHECLEKYFVAKKESKILDIIDLQKISFDYIESININSWKLQKTTPTIEECRIKAIKISNNLLKNFFSEISVYDLDEILEVELYCNEFLTINGVDIPLPCHAKIDLFGIKDGKLIIIDHKSKSKFSDEKELAFSVGKQSVTYYHCIESSMNLKVDEVWFIENKHSKNRDNSNQINCFKVTMDNDTIKLYDALLYEPLRRMVEAVSNPDYVYLINEFDNFVDKAKVYNFWSRTQILEIDAFNVADNKKDLISKRLKKIRNASLEVINPKVIKKFQENADSFIHYNLNNKNMNNEEKIEHTLKTLGIIVSVKHTLKGYSSDTFLLEISQGSKISNVNKYKLDIARALSVSNVIIRKNLLVYNSNSYLAIEVSKKRVDDLIFDDKYLVGQKIPLGIDNFNNLIYWDLNNPSTPHVLIGGATGSGKSVSLISTIEYAKLSGVSDIIILDPKFEFLKYKSKTIKVFNDIDDIEKEMKNLVEVMNDMVKKGQKRNILIVFDEFADALSQSKKGRDLDVKEMVKIGTYKQTSSELKAGLLASPKMKLQTTKTLKSLEENLRILLQKGRSVGFRIIAATQRASTKVITGDAKVNFPVQICFKVPKAIDSRVMIDEEGAELLAGSGDGLINSPEYDRIIRFQGFYKS